MKLRITIPRRGTIEITLGNFENYLNYFLDTTHSYARPLRNEFISSLNTYLYLIRMVPKFTAESLDPCQEIDCDLSGIYQRHGGDLEKIIEILELCGQQKFIYRYVELLDMFEKINPDLTKDIISIPYEETNETILDLVMIRCCIFLTFKELNCANSAEILEQTEPYRSRDDGLFDQHLSDIEAEILSAQKLSKLVSDQDLEKAFENAKDTTMNIFFGDQQPLDSKLKLDLLFSELLKKVQSPIPPEAVNPPKVLSIYQAQMTNPSPATKITILQTLRDPTIDSSEMNL